MASDPEYVKFVLDQCGHEGELVAKAMFGEYGLYLRGKLVAMVCDDRLLVKPTAAGRAFIGEVTEGLPYPGGKPMFHVEEKIDDRNWVAELLEETFAELPEPKPKKPRRAAGAKRARR